MKILVIAIAASQVAGAPSDFPKFDDFHANCTIAVKINAPCADTFKSIESVVSKNDDPSHGTYKLKESDEGYVWGTRLGAGGKYTDDVFWGPGVDQDGSCLMNSKSRSQSLSFYDFETNFCNMYNAYRSPSFEHDYQKLADIDFKFCMF